MTPLSILELVRVTQETDARGALNNARDLAAHAEKLGYRRVWVAEHHNMAGIASAATSVVLAHHRRGDDDHSGRGRRHHASEPRALHHRRAVRNAGAAFSRPHRPRAWPRARHRPAHAARLASSAGGRRHLSARRSGIAGVPGAGRTKSAHPGGAGGGNGRAALYPGIEPFRRDAGRRIGAALCVRIAFRARSSDHGAWRFTAAGSSRPSNSTGLMRSSASTSSRPKRTRRRGGSRRRSRCHSPTSSVARAV